MTEMAKKRKERDEEGAGLRGMAQQPLPPGCYRAWAIDPTTRMPYYSIVNAQTGTLIDRQSVPFPRLCMYYPQPSPPQPSPPPSHSLLNEMIRQKKVKTILSKQRDKYSAQLKKVHYERYMYLAKARNDEKKLKQEKTALENSLAKAKEDIEDADEKNKDLTYFINGLQSKIDEIAKLAEEAGADTHKIKEIKERTCRIS